MLLRFRLETRANSVVCSRTGYKTTFWAEIMHNCQFPPLLAEVSTGLWTQEAISSSLFEFMQTQHTQNLQSLTLQLVIQDFTRVAAGEKQMIFFSPTSSRFVVDTSTFTKRPQLQVLLSTFQSFIRVASRG